MSSTYNFGNIHLDKKDNVQFGDVTGNNYNFNGKVVLGGQSKSHFGPVITNQNNEGKNTTFTFKDTIIAKGKSVNHFGPVSKK